MIEDLVEQLMCCLRTLDERGLNIAAAHLSAAIEILQADLPVGSNTPETEEF